MPNSFKINNMLSTTQDHQHTVRIRAFKRTNPKQISRIWIKLQKILGNISYIFSLSFTLLNNHSRLKLITKLQNL